MLRPRLKPAGVSILKLSLRSNRKHGACPPEWPPGLPLLPPPDTSRYIMIAHRFRSRPPSAPAFQTETDHRHSNPRAVPPRSSPALSHSRAAFAVGASGALCRADRRCAPAEQARRSAALPVRCMTSTATAPVPSVNMRSIARSSRRSRPSPGLGRGCTAACSWKARRSNARAEGPGPEKPVNTRLNHPSET